MEVIVAKSFLKDLKLKPKHIVASVSKLVSVLEEAKTLESAEVDYTKMEGQKKGESYYRIRLGDYRIGVEYIHPKIIMLRILTRGDVYKHFPPAK
jgi:mRNA interferase RelE/StbE